MFIYEIDHDTFNWILLIVCGLAIPIVFGLKMLAEYVAERMVKRNAFKTRMKPCSVYGHECKFPCGCKEGCDKFKESFK